MTDETRPEVALVDRLRARVARTEDRAAVAALVLEAVRALLRSRVAELWLPADEGEVLHGYADGHDLTLEVLPGPGIPAPDGATDLHTSVTTDGDSGWLGARGVPDAESSLQLLHAVATVLEARLQAAPRIAGTSSTVRRGAPTDHLTGLGSHQVLEEQAPLLMIDDEAAGRHSALLMLDIDEFKLVNDTLGHAAGDAVLIAVADRLRECLRDTDLICRMGGDEFAVLATGLSDEEDAAAVARKLLQALRPEITVEDVRMHVDISVGIAVRGVDGDSLAELRRSADRAMYDAKAAGSGRYRRPATTPRSRGRRITVPQLTDALHEGALVLHHHPQFDSTTGQVVATEALLRWPHPDLGLLLPRDFLPLAEQAGLLGLVDRTVVALVVRDIARLHALSASLRVAANISPRALLGRALLDHVARCLADSRVPPELLTLEIMEPASQYARSTAQVLAEIEQLGCRVSVHEFGVARTSVGVLARFTGIREVKIAPQLVGMLPEQEAAERTVRAIVAAAHALSILVVAEGIDSPADATRLRALGCDVLQGDHLSPELTVAEIIAMLGVEGTEAG